MAPMRVARSALACASLLALGALAAACGGGGGGEAAGPATVPSGPAPPKSSFPDPAGRSLRSLIKQETDGHSELKVAPTGEVFYPGRNRYAVGIAERNDGQVDDAEVAFYYARVPPVKKGAKSAAGNKGPNAKVQSQALDQPAVGPFPARIESLGTKPAFRSTMAADPETARVVYVAELPFPRNGGYRVAAMVRHDGELDAKLLGTANVGEYTHVPRPGQPAPLIHTPTAQEVGGDAAKITTREPPDTQNEVDYAEALGKEPILLLFATPKFCQSRVCGPVVDVAEQAKHEYGDKAAFIHMEIFNHNDPDAEVRPQVRRFHLPTEPWLFAINREGVVSSAIEGAFGLELMDEVAEKVIAE
ncbi:MAG: hypothetical protein U0R71_16315 [Solirubrobacterales bacterium]